VDPLFWSDSDLAANVEDAQQNGYCSFFYMDETEITNSEYREFVEWVKDSTRVRLILADESGQTATDPKAKVKCWKYR
jgi:formylglycine-generating enzyme required for sulfatase activity